MEIKKFDGKVPSGRRGREVSAETLAIRDALLSKEVQRVDVKTETEGQKLSTRIRAQALVVDTGVSVGVSQEGNQWFVAFQGKAKQARRNAPPKPTPAKTAPAKKATPAKRVAKTQKSG